MSICKLKILIFSLLLLVAGTFSVSAQIVDAEGQYVDTVFNDHVDRTAEDFVIASLLVADPGTVMYSVLGHASLRLRCPEYEMDLCYTYESEDERQKVLSFLAGKLKMGLFVLLFDDFCSLYSKDGRGVYEYTLNLPIEVKRELWRVMDEQLKKNKRVPYDYYRYGCAITIINVVKEALGDIEIVYDRSLYEHPRTAREIYFQYTKPTMWMRFVSVFIVGSEADIVHNNDRQLIAPQALLHAWQQAKVNGKPLLESESNILVKGESQVAIVWFTPMVLALLLLVLAIANLFWGRPYFDWLMLTAQTFIGCFMTYLICFSDLCCTDWNWLIIPFNPLPLIFWYWRKHWALPYAGILAVWCAAMASMILWGHPRVDWSHILMVVAWIITIVHQIDMKTMRSKRLKNR